MGSFRYADDGAYCGPTDDTVAYWESRDACPDCGAIVAPYAAHAGTNHYECQAVADDPVTWTRESS